MGDGMKTTKNLHYIQLYLYSTYSSSSSVVFCGPLSPCLPLYVSIYRYCQPRSCALTCSALARFGGPFWCKQQEGPPHRSQEVHKIPSC